MSLTVEKCLQAWTNSLKQMNATADIVFFGDSLTYYGDFASVFPDKVVCNLGLRGDTIQGMIDRVEQVKILEPSKVYMMVGINDLTSYSPTRFEELYSALIQRILLLLPKVELVIQNILPVNDKVFHISCNNEQITECNKIINRLVIRYNLQFIDLFSVYAKNGKLPHELSIDGIHLSANGYNHWYRLLQE